MKLLLDEMYAPAIAEQLRARGHDVATVHDPAYRALEGEPDEEVWAAAIADHRALVSENVRDFRRLEADALAASQPRPPLIFTTDRQFPRGDPATIGRLVTALDALLAAEPHLVTALFLKLADRRSLRAAARRAVYQPCRPPLREVVASDNRDAPPIPRVGLRRPWRVGPSVAAPRQYGPRRSGDRFAARSVARAPAPRRRQRCLQPPMWWLAPGPSLGSLPARAGWSPRVMEMRGIGETGVSADLGPETSRRVKAGPAIRRARTRWLVHAAERKRAFRTDGHDDVGADGMARPAGGESRVCCPCAASPAFTFARAFAADGVRVAPNVRKRQPACGRSSTPRTRPGYPCTVGCRRLGRRCTVCSDAAAALRLVLVDQLGTLPGCG